MSGNKVYVVVCDVKYEGEDIVAVYDSLEKANSKVLSFTADLTALYHTYEETKSGVVTVSMPARDTKWTTRIWEVL